MAVGLSLTAAPAVAAPVAEIQEPSPASGSCETLVGSRAAGPLDDPCPGIRPGSQIVNSTGNYCTVNFIFSDRKRWYVGTAGHCVGGVGERIRAVNPDLEIGPVVYRLLEGDSRDRDFALIRVRPKVRKLVETEGCAWGGPTGIAAEPQTLGAEILHMGYGTGLAFVPGATNHSLTYARRGTVVVMDDQSHMAFLGVASPGDSGSGAYLSDGKALGVITAVGITAGSSSTGTVTGGRIEPLLQEASRSLKKKLFLITAEGALVR